MEADTGLDRLLLIDDDVELCELVSEYLAGEGFQVEVVNDGLQGVEKTLSGDFRLVILDVMMPSLNGFEALRRIRRQSSVPVIMLTARGDDVDRIVGLEIGADDYMPKPFNPRELAARIRAVLRRAAQPTRTTGGGDERLAAGDVEMAPAARIVRRGGEIVELTAAEFDLLELFLRSVGQVLRREDLAPQVLGRPYNPFDRSLDMHVSNLRRKLGDRPEGGGRIKAIRGVGYIYAAPGDSHSGEG